MTKMEPCPYMIKSLKKSSLKSNGEKGDCWMTFNFLWRKVRFALGVPGGGLEIRLVQA